MTKKSEKFSLTEVSKSSNSTCNTLDLISVLLDDHLSWL